MSRLILFLFVFFIYNETHSQENNLEKAFKYNSPATLDMFFEKWQQEVPPITDHELSELSDTIQEAYKVFSTFYTPLNLSRIGHSEWGDSIYNKQSFLIVQNSLDVEVQKKVYFTDEDLDELLNKELEKDNPEVHLKFLLRLRENNKVRWYFEEAWGSLSLPQFEKISQYPIFDFRPQLEDRSREYVYLTSEYNKILDDFLCRGKSRSKDVLRELGRRANFLFQNGIRVWQPHWYWNDSWHLLTYPEVRTIVFDEKMEYAKVYFTIVYQGGEAYLKKEGDSWMLISSRITWIE